MDIERETDNTFASPELLELKVICYKCKNKPVNCECSDKWFRLHGFKARILIANVLISLGDGTEKQRKLVCKNTQYI